MSKWFVIKHYCQSENRDGDWENQSQSKSLISQGENAKAALTRYLPDWENKFEFHHGDEQFCEYVKLPSVSTNTYLRGYCEFIEITDATEQIENGLCETSL